MGRVVKDTVSPVRPGVVRCAVCDTAAGEATLRRIYIGEKEARGLTEFDGTYICVGGCAKQRTRGLQRFIRSMAKEVRG